jgi:hypothetical protein
MSKKEIELIKGQIDKLSDSHFDVDSWKSSTNVILSRIFGSNYEGIKSIKSIRHSAGGISFGGQDSAFWDNKETCKKQGRDILGACIKELETFGVPEIGNNKEHGINITLTQNQHQTVNINLIISALEDELTGTQMKEIKEIMKVHEPVESKKKKISDKLKSFGSDVASNIISNILTNPGIWG